MFWFALAAVALAAKSAASQANASNAASMDAYTNSLEATSSTNEAIQTANLTNTIRTGYKVGLINLQRANTKKQAIQAGYDVSVKGADALAATQNNAAASGTVGSSVDAAADNVKKKVDDSQIGIDQSFMQEMLNANLQIEQTVNQGIDSLQSARKVNQTMPTTANAFTSALIGGASTAFSMYAASSMSTGAASSTAASSTGTYSGVTATSGSYGLQAPSSALSSFLSR